MKRSLTFTTVLVALVTSYSFIVSLRASIPQVPSQTWTATGDAVTARAGASGTLLLDGHVLITGGMNDAGVTASAERYSPAAGGFLAAPPMQDARANHTSTRLLDGRVLVAGGLGADGHALGSVEIYDPAANVWTPAGPLFHPRAGHTATLLPDGRVLVAGGDDSGVPTAALEVFDPSIEGFSLLEATLSVPRMGHAAALADGKVIIVGGFDGTNALASVDVYDPLIDSVSPGPSLGVARAGHSATTLLDGQVLVAGGASDTSELASAEVFDPTSNTFSAAGGSLAIARQHHLAFLLPHNNSVLIVGGTSGGNAVGAAELYVPWEGAGGSFVATNALSVARAWATGGALSVPASEVVRTGPADGLLLLTGGSASSSASGALKSAELFGFATIKTDKFDYAPGTTVTITGSGWQPGEYVALMLRESPAFDEHPLLDVQADENGNIVSTEFVPDEHDLNIQFYLTGFGAESQAQTTFKDGKAASITVATPTSVTVAAGGTAIYGAATVTFNGNFNASNPSCTATLSATGLPTGATAVFGANPITRTGTAGDVTTSLIVTTTASGPSATPAGTYPFKARATDGAGCQDTNFAETPSNLNLTLVVAAAKIDSVTVGSQTGTLTFGTAGSATYTVTVGRIGSSGPLDANLSLTTTLPTGATASFVPNTVHWNNGDSAAKTSTLTVTTTSATPAGSTASTVQASNPAVPGDSSTGNGTLAVDKRPVTVTFTAADKTYDGNNTAAVSGCVIATGKVGSDDVTCAVASGTFASANASASAQTVSATATLGGTAASNYTVTNPVTTTAKINPKSVTVTFTAADKTYDGTNTAAVSACAIATGKVGSDDVTCSVASGTFASANASASAQTVSATATLGGTAASNYTVTNPVTTTAKIDPAPVTVTFTAADKTYDGNNTAAVSGCVIATGKVGSDDVTCTVASGTFASANASVSAQTVSATATLGGTAASNYTVTNPVTATAKINPKSVTVTFTAADKTYDGTNTAAVSACAIATGKVGSDDVTCSVASGTFASANASESTQTVLATATLGGTAAGNYTVTNPVTATAKINRATATVAVTPYNVTYDATAHTATGTATGVGGADLSSGLTLTGTTHTDAGTYAADAWSFAGGTNYNDASGTVTDKIAKADASVVVNGYSGTYDAAAHGATLAHATGVGGVNLSTGVNLGSSFTNVPGGTAHWTFSAANYNDQSGDVAITIGKATATVAVTPYNVTYDATAHTATGSATGIGGVSLSGLDLSGTTHTNAGTTTDTWTFTDSTGNYNNATDTVVDKIAKATASVVVNGYSGTYDAAAHGATLAHATGVGGVNLSGGVSLGDSFTNVPGGTAHWTFSAANYNDQSGDVAITIGKATATVAVTPYNVTYDATAHTATGSATGIGGVSLSGLDLSGTTHTNAGTTTDTWTFTDSTGNYNNATDTVVDKIAKATASVVVNGYSGTYDAAAHGATLAHATGVGGVNLSGGVSLGNSFTNVPGGTAHWTFSAANYNDQSGDVAITIGKATATVAVTPYNVTYDAAAHTATGSATGIGGVSLSGLDLSGTTHTNAGTTTDTWTFTDSTGNYNNATDTVVDTIGKATATVAVTPYNVTYDATAHTATGTATGVGGADLSSSLTLTGTTHTNAGTHAADAWSFAGGTNYNDASGTVTDTIAKADASVVVNGYSGTYDAAAHGATLAHATGVGGVNLSTGVSLGSSFTNVPGGTAHWTFSAANYNDQSGDVAITIGKATATVVLGDLSQTYTGSPLTPTATTTPASLAIVWTGTPQTAAGTYPVTATISESNYQGSANGSFVIGKATQAAFSVAVPASITYGLTETATSAGGSGAGAVTFSAAASTGCAVNSSTGVISVNDASGTCAISATKAGDNNYNGPVSNGPQSVVLNKAAQNTLTVTAPGAVTYGTIGTATASGGSGTGALSFSADASTGCSVAGTAVSVTNATLPCALTATKAGDNNYNAATSAAFTVTLNKAPATVVLSNLTQIYTGSPLTPTATTTPPGLTIAWTNAPKTDTGTYSVTAAVNSPNYQGSANGSFVIGAWTTAGFFQPVDMSTTVVIWNTVKGGSTVPLKFNLFAGTTEKTSVSDIASFFQGEISCTLGGFDDAVDSTLLTTGGTSLRYSGTSGSDGQFIQNWQTPKQPGKCYKVIMTAKDGSTISAFFKTK